jgi:polar amino acid transport system substrate-binding protein
MNTTSFRIRLNKNTENAKIRQIWGFATLLFLILISVAVAAASQPIEIVTFHYPPYINGDGTGMGEKIVAAAFQTQGHSVNFTIYPSKRAINNFQKGKGEMFLGLRDYFSEQEINAQEIFYFRRVLVYLKDQYPELHINSLDDLKGKKIGVVLGSSQVIDFQAAGLIEEITSKHENNIKKLYARRVDFIYTLDLTAIGLIEKLFPGQPADFGIFEYQRNAADLVVRKNSLEEKTLQVFRTGLKTIIENGTYHKIMEQSYGAGKVPTSAEVKASEIK